MIKKLSTSILYQVTSLFLASLVVTVVIVSSENWMLRLHSLDTLTREIYDNQVILFNKTKDAIYERMEYYAFDSDPGKPSIWKLRGSRSPIEAVRNGSARRIEIALKPQYEKLLSNGTLNTIAIFTPEGLPLKIFVPTDMPAFTGEKLGADLQDYAFKKQVHRGLLIANENIQLFITFPIYANATILAYVYYGMSFNQVAEAFQKDSNSLILIPEFPKSMYIKNLELENLEFISGLTVPIVETIEGQYHALTPEPIPLAGNQVTTLVFAKNIDSTVKAGEMYFYQALLGASIFLIASGIFLFYVLRNALNPLGSAIDVLQELSNGNLKVKITKKRDDEVGKISLAIEAFRERIVAFNSLQNEANQRRKSQQAEILKQTQMLTRLLPDSRQSGMGKTIQDLQNEIQRSEVKKLDFSFDVNTDEVSSLFAKSFGSLAGELEAQYSELENLVKQRTAELEKARDQANTASETKSKFLANMSHELRTPLNAIIGYSEMITEEAEESPDDDLDWLIGDAKKIKDSATHQLQLINDILDHSKIEAGKLELYNSEFEIETALRFIKDISKPLAEKNSNTLEYVFENDLGSIFTDETRLRQILLNFLSNACKFTKQGKVVFSVTRQFEDNLDWINFTVKDSGIGMTPEQVSKIFEEFTQADDDTTAKFGGTGLGLAITKRLTEMMGGEIKVSSIPGEGSTFELFLPKQPAPVT